MRAIHTCLLLPSLAFGFGYSEASCAITTSNIFWSVDLTVVNATAWDAIIPVLEASAATEAGTLIYDISGNGTHGFIYERYVDAAAAIEHTETFLANFAADFTAAVAIDAIKVHSAVDDRDLLDLLDGLGALLYGPLTLKATCDHP
mmetsp:Transcript_5796/g.18867  ORF Transcript_5796/g.18867 Transcript_5796/m.18867 type:complete len:146 (+) Transcript_5796:19-456(+)